MNQHPTLWTKLYDYADHRRLKDAFNLLKSQSRSLGAVAISDKIDNVEQNYAYMLNYLRDGVNDPERNDIYNDIVLDVYGLIDSLVLYDNKANNPSVYYSNLRYFESKSNTASIADIIASIVKLADSLSLFSLVMSSANTDEHKQRMEMERLQIDLFTRLWVKPYLSAEDAEAITNMLQGSQVAASVKQHAVSALMLGLLDHFDKHRLTLLMATYMQADDVNVSSAALIGLLLGLWKYRMRPLPRKLRDMLMAVKDRPDWRSDLRIAFIELIRARDTERINRKMFDEIMPKMESIRPQIDKINNMIKGADDAMDLQENPEWQDLLDKSGITEQLKELTEIQMEGGDVMMSTFAHLKQFPFFQTVSNWFLPFDASHTSVSETVKSLDIVGDMMENARFLCDSDKYSFMMAINSVPSSQRELMISQMKAQSSNIYEAMSSMSSPQGPDARRMAVNSYMQNIYRFFKLYSRHSEFFDPFGQSLNLTAVPSLASDFDDADMLQVVAEFYFKLKYMQEALDVYMLLEALDPGDAPRCQKIGYCYESLGKYTEALDYYQRADLLDAESAWTVKRLAVTYRHLGDMAMSLKYYKRLAAIRPDDINAALVYGQSLMENERYREAIQQLHKVEFMDESSTRAWRPLAWTLFLSGDLSGAKAYYDKIAADNPSANDLLNMGHVALAMGKAGTALDAYKRAVAKHRSADNASPALDLEWIISAMRDDTPSLLRAGVDASLIPIITDAILFAL